MRRTLHWVVALGLALFFALPWLWMALVSLKTRSAVFLLPKRLLAGLTADNYYTALIEKLFIHDFANSVLLGLLSSSIAMTAAVPAAYAISRRGQSGQGYYTFILSTRFLPAISVVVPLFVLFAAIGLQSHFAGILLVHAAVAVSLSVVLLAAFFDRVPRWLDDAARLDGARPLQVLLSHVVPTARAGVAVTWFLTFLVSWNEFLFASILTSADTRTLPVVIPGLVTPHGTYWGQVAALGVTASVPGVLICFWLVTRTRGSKQHGT